MDLFTLKKMQSELAESYRYFFDEEAGSEIKSIRELFPSGDLPLLEVLREGKVTKTRAGEEGNALLKEIAGTIESLGIFIEIEERAQPISTLEDSLYQKNEEPEIPLEVVPLIESEVQRKQFLDYFYSKEALQQKKALEKRDELKKKLVLILYERISNSSQMS
ncbi:MAG: hypothetical protein ACI9S8_001958 [Chlamydiales bacterium]|jgi:hypothetical protein